MKRIAYVFIVLAFLAACNQNNPHKSSTFEAIADEEMLAPQAAAGIVTRRTKNLQPPASPEKKIIKRGEMEIEVDQLEKSKAIVDSLVKRNKGYYANESLSNTNYQSNYDLKIRIPVKNFERFITEVELGNGRILFKEINANDVTDQFIDLESRLKNKRAYLKRFRELLEKANSIKEILEIEEKIRNLEEEIDSTTGRLKYLSNSVAFSTLKLSLIEPKEYKYQPTKRTGFFEEFKDSISKGWYAFVDFILFAIRVWPFWILAFLAITFIRNRRRKRKLKK